MYLNFFSFSHKRTSGSYGGAFVSNVGSDSASQLQTGDRLLAVNSKGLIALRHTELQQVLTELPQKFQILVLRLSSGHWRELQAEVDVTDDPEYELYCRGVSKLPLINQLQMAYVCVSVTDIYDSWTSLFVFFFRETQCPLGSAASSLSYALTFVRTFR